MCLLSIVYAFSALAKINPDLLSGAVLGAALGRESLVLLPPLLLRPDAMAMLSGLVIATEFFLSVGFWIGRTRLWVTAIGLCFHVGVPLIFPFSFVNVFSFLQVGGAVVILYPLFSLPRAPGVPAGSASLSLCGARNSLEAP